MKKRICCLAMAASIFLCSCAANPEQDVVISKNDCSFDVNVVQSATQPAGQNESATQNASYTDSFTSTDGSVNFSLNINKEIVSGAMPVVTVSPHLLSGDDVQRIANALFGDAVFYEQGPLLDEQFSKSELQRKLNLHTPYTNGENLIALFGPERYTPDYLNTTTDIFFRIRRISNLINLLSRKEISMIQIIICDDNEVFLEKLRSQIHTLLKKDSINSVVYAYSCAEDIPVSQMSEADILFLDIDFSNKKYTGIDIAKKVRSVNNNAACFRILESRLWLLYTFHHFEFDHINQCFPPTFGTAEGEFHQHGIFIYLHIRFLIAGRAWNPMWCPVFVVHSVDLRF